MAEYYAGGGGGGGGGGSYGGAGTFWKGADGNVYVAGDQGTNNAGAWDDNSLSYWQNLGYTQEADPLRTMNGPVLSTSTTRDPATSTSTFSGSGATAPVADDVAFLDDQEAQLRALLGRVDTNQTQALQRNQDEYDTQYGEAGRDKERAYAGYADQKIAQNQGKLGAQNTNYRNANNGYRSLSQIIGRAAGRGSSAFREMLPNVIGKDLSSKQRATSETFGRNLQGIDKAQGDYDLSFAGVIADLLKQRNDNEYNTKSAFEEKRQGINAQLAQNAGQRELVRGGGYAQVKAAQDPFQNAINTSRDTVEGFFNQYRTPYVRQQAVASTPELAQYTTDRASINAQAQGGDSNNPYAALLRKKLQGQA